MRIGDLRHRVTIEKKIVTIDAYGDEVVSWAEVATVWAAVEPLSGREFLEGRRQENEINHRIRIRYRQGLTPSMRVVWGPRAFDIESVIERESRRREMWLMCREIVGGYADVCRRDSRYASRDIQGVYQQPK